MRRIYARLVDALIAGVIAGMLFSVLLPIASRLFPVMGNPLHANFFPSGNFAYVLCGMLTAIAFWGEQGFWKTGMSHIVSWTAFLSAIFFASLIVVAYAFQGVNLYDAVYRGYYASLPLIPAAIIGAAVAQLPSYLARKRDHGGPR